MAQEDNHSDAIHVPEDAGEHAEALKGILLRIPDSWGRWISCSRGWYPLLVELDEQLRTLLPNYVIHQVKEKFGGLRFYWASGEERIADLERRVELAAQLVDTAERRAGFICELCSASGRLHRTPSCVPCYKTLCPSCAKREGYVPS